nr:MAG TPA: hypothetical protein [Caudoviricetes sp.]
MIFCHNAATLAFLFLQYKGRRMPYGRNPQP